MEATGDAIAEAVLQQFDQLPQKRKPQDRGNGVREWVPLSGIVAQGNDGLQCIAVGTGMKCLPANKIPHAHGLVLHDWHAEIITVRAFNRFLLEECMALILSQAESSVYLRRRQEDEITERHFQPFTIREDVRLHMYCSEAPCGDASMELTMAAQDDATPWTLPTTSETISVLLPTSPSSPPSTLLPGRAYFSALGIVRRKPSRPDAPSTLSKSCSDKLCLKQCTSLLSSIASLLISPENAYLQTLVLPRSQYSSRGCGRAFGDGVGDGGNAPGRMRNARARRWKGTGYHSHPFTILCTSREFSFSRRSQPPSHRPNPNPNPNPSLVPSNLSTAWTAAFTSAPRGIEESLIGGVLQGRKAFPSPSRSSFPIPSPLVDPRGVSLLSRKKSWRLAAKIASLLTTPGSRLAGLAIARALGFGMEMGSGTHTYRDVKQCELLRSRREVKDEVRQLCLKGWVSNDARGEEFAIANM